MDILEKDKIKMYSLYMDDKKITHKNIADLYQNKYPNLTQNAVGVIIRELSDKNSPRIDFEHQIQTPISFGKVDIQKSRKE